MKDAPKPKSIWRRLERAMMGFVMTVFAFFLDKLVMRALKKQGKDKTATPPEPTQITTKGGSIDFEPEL